jgi:UDP-N-acetylmuramate--alanine ligase
MSVAIAGSPAFTSQSEIRHAHLVGICGSGMTPLAHALLSMGIAVSGSDPSTAKGGDLARKGAVLYAGHAADNLGDADVIVFSSAIPHDNPELVAARDRGLMIAHRSELLAWFLARHESILIAGTHGKTTTTTMLTLLLESAGLDPWGFVGGSVREFGGNLRIGTGKLAVAEADESDGSFLCLPRNHAIITNIEAEHLNYWIDENRLFQGFWDFCSEIPRQGHLVICIDDPGIRRMVKELDRPYVTYSVRGDVAEFHASEIELRGSGSSFNFCHRGRLLGRVNLAIPGLQNVSNAVASLALAVSLGADPELILDALSGFEGVDRRFTKRQHPSGCLVIDDYGHHPTEIAATMAAARLLAEERAGQLHVVFQPHRYSRTQSFFPDFGPALAAADSIILTDIYAAGEQPIPGIDGRSLSQDIHRRTGRETHYIPAFDDIKKALDERIKVSDIVLLLGAGSVTNLSHLLSS